MMNPMTVPFRGLPPVTPETAPGLTPMSYEDALKLYRACGSHPFSFVDTQGVVRTIVVNRGRVVATFPWIGRAHYERGLWGELQ